MTVDERTAGLAEYLRKIADNIERMSQLPADMPTAKTLRDAWAQLDPLIPRLEVSVELSRYAREVDPRLTVKVWDGSKFFEGTTVAEAVAKAVDYHTPKPDVDALEALAEVLPVGADLAEAAA